ncbi:hypothetical protein BGX28_008164, partial [Mortierella sp. GBA30]
MEGARANPSFLAGDSSEILLPLMAPDEEFGRCQLGAIIEATTLSTTGRTRVSTPVLRPEWQKLRFKTSDGHQYIYSFHGSKLDLVAVDTVVINPCSLNSNSCSTRCFEEQTAVPDKIVPGMVCKNHFVMPSGLTFSVTFNTLRSEEWSMGTERQSIALSVSNGLTTLLETLRIPAVMFGDIPVERSECKVIFNVSKQEMIIYSDIFVMVWGLPKTINAPFTLLLTWWTQRVVFQTGRRTDWYWTTVTRCPHLQHYLRTFKLGENYEDVVVDMVQIASENAFNYSNCLPFLNGILVLIEVFGSADDTLKQAILRYVGHYINTYPDPDDLLQSVMAKICRSVTQNNHARYASFLQALLDSPQGRWVPRPDFMEDTNPICILLGLTKKLPRAIDLVRILVHYCTRMANKEKDMLFVLPLMIPLHRLLEQKQLYSDVACSILQGLAFIPANDRSYIIDHHAIAHPPSLRWKFWRPNNKPLYECHSPVLQLDRNPLAKDHNTLNDNFTSDLFAASFDMLWHVESDVKDSRKICIAQKSQSWFNMILHMFWLSLKVKRRTSIACNEFALESLDNPAIVALVEYKWNTIGFTYWLCRFVFQCCYYLLVLTAVFMQVYSDNMGPALFNVFIAIIVLSMIFLWLELTQLLNSWKRYLSSPYNYADIAAFTFPFAGSIIQLRNIAENKEDGQVYVLSFSVLFIFIHF